MLLSEIVELNLIKKICYRISYVKLVCFAVACKFCFVSDDCNNRKVSAEYFDTTQRYVLLPSPRQQIKYLSRRFSIYLLTLSCSTPLNKNYALIIFSIHFIIRKYDGFVNKIISHIQPIYCKLVAIQPLTIQYSAHGFS